MERPRVEGADMGLLERSECFRRKILITARLNGRKSAVEACEGERVISR